MSSILEAIKDHLIKYPGRFSRSDLQALVLNSVFIFHTWAIFQVFNDAAWVLRRSNMADFMAYSSYAMAFALFESLVLTLAVWVLGILSPGRIKNRQLVSLLGTTLWIIAVWAIASQLLSMPDLDFQAGFVGFLFAQRHPLRLAYLIAVGLFGLIVFSAAGPIFLIVKNERASQTISGVLGRLAVLSWLFLFLDATGLIYILFRNISL